MDRSEGGEKGGPPSETPPGGEHEEQSKDQTWRCLSLTLCPHQSSSWMKKMQMVCRVVVLLILSSCLCAATFVVNVTQSSSQAEQNHNITLEWTFTTTPERSWRDLFIYCSLLAPLRESVLYLVQEGVEVSQFQDEQFAGRVQGDKDVLREGRIRLHLSSLRTEDSGTYKCEVKTEDGFSSGMCHLNVSAAAEQLLTHGPTWTPQPQEQTFIRITLGAALVCIIIIIVVSVFIFIRKRK